MTKKTIVAALISCAAFTTANAGGMLTNTNQNVAFNRNPARDAAIGIDGVYSNPAGVVFMPEGFHISLNWQAAFQKREITSTNPNFNLGARNNDSNTKKFVGEATAPFIPSVQAAYNKGNWSFQFNFAVAGGGGKCTFDDGLGSFESVIANYASKFVELNQLQQLSQMGVPGMNKIPTVQKYDINSYLQGSQYYFGFTLGTAYKINDNWSIYGGIRMNYGTASYKARITDITVVTPNENMGLAKYVGTVKSAMTEGAAFAANPANQQAMVAGVTQAIMQQAAQAGQPVPQQVAVAMATEKVKSGLGSLAAAGQQLSAAGETLAPYLEHGVNLNCDQSGFGIAPIIGIDYHNDKLTVAAKYEFRTHMRLTNSSDVIEASVVPAINKFQDGKRIEEDIPAMLSVGAEYKVCDNVRVSVGYHHFFDTESRKYNNAQLELVGGTNEYLGGVEWDATKKLTLSTGFQITRYSNTDKFINDMSFVVNSGSFGLGAKYQVSKKVAINAAYLKTIYGTYNQSAPDANGTINSFTRKNDVAALGVDFSF